MTKKQIKKFFISLINEPSAVWTATETKFYILFQCKFNNIKIELEKDFYVKFIYDDYKTERIKLNDIGISEFEWYFPYFGFGRQILRRIRKEESNIKPDLVKQKLNNVSNLLLKSKVINRDIKINQILGK